MALRWSHTDTAASSAFVGVCMNDGTSLSALFVSTAAQFVSFRFHLL